MDIFRRKTVFWLLLAFSTVGAARAENCDCAKKIQRLQNQLIHLPPEGASPDRVSQLVTKLSKLQPKYANRYFRWGISKLPYPGYNDNQSKLARQVTRIVKNSDLPRKEVAKITTQVEQAVESGTVPPPTSPQA
jgi:hypothetical protein